jgi:hypothetical protein
LGQNWTFWQKVSSTKVDPQATLNHISLLLGQFFTPAFVFFTERRICNFKCTNLLGNLSNAPIGLFGIRTRAGLSGLGDVKGK